MTKDVPDSEDVLELPSFEESLKSLASKYDDLPEDKKALLHGALIGFIEIIDL